MVGWRVHRISGDLVRNERRRGRVADKRRIAKRRKASRSLRSTERRDKVKSRARRSNAGIELMRLSRAFSNPMNNLPPHQGCLNAQVKFGTRVDGNWKILPFNGACVQGCGSVKSPRRGRADQTSRVLMDDLFAGGVGRTHLGRCERMIYRRELIPHVVAWMLRRKWTYALALRFWSKIPGNSVYA